MKLLKYDHFDPVTNTIAQGEAVLDAYKVLEDSDPDPTDYTDQTGLAGEIECWHDHADHLIGEKTNFMDWKCLRDKIKQLVEDKGGADYANYVANCTAAERAIAAIYVPTKIFDNLGAVQLATDSGGAAEASHNIKNYLSLSAEARGTRYDEFVEYAYQALGKSNGLLAEDLCAGDRLDVKYINRGVLLLSQDGVDGLEDWIRSQGSYSGTGEGLYNLIDEGTYTILNGLTLDDFIDGCIEILDEGKYPQ